jgi:UDP-N-acetylglucosamine--N-acetylmuramyl-(pentapeptide) pyrophosphoryl-undecaprenol N-acetylglucosamine transferase
MRYLIAGGGTGGHIYPALAIASALRSLDAAAEFLFVGTGHGLEADLVPRAGYRLEKIELYGFQRRVSLRNIKNVFLLGRSLWQVRRILREYRPDVVVGTGGYVCGPVVAQAARSGIPTLIQEQNALAGITNKILGRLVDVVALGYAEAAASFAGRKARLVVTGNPVRPDLLFAEREDACRLFGFRTDLPVILITGGSQGARSINQAALTLHMRCRKENKPVQILHITGQTDYNDIIRALDLAKIEINRPDSMVKVLPYVHEMPKALATASLAVSRAGAIGLAELSLCGVPSILIPYPHAAENHQEINARSLESKGAAIVVRDAELSGDWLFEIVSRLLDDPGLLQTMGTAAVQAAHPAATMTIAGLVLELAGRSK